MLWTDLLYLPVALMIAFAVVYGVLALVYPRGRQVEFRIDRGSSAGRVLGISGLKVRVRSVHYGTEHTVALTRVRRR